MLTKIGAKCWIFSALTLLGNSCGGGDDGDKNESSSANEVGGVEIVAAADGKIKLDFSAAPATAEYIIVPYYTGNVANVNGASSEFSDVAVNLPATKLVSPILSPSGLGGEPIDMRTLRAEVEAMARFVGNHFDPNKGVDQQKAGFWQVVRRYDALRQQYGTPSSQGSSLSAIKADVSYEDELKMIIAGQASNKSLSLLNTRPALTASCPAVNDDVPMPDGTTVTANEVYDGDTYCLIVADDWDRSFETIDNIKSSIASALKTYKGVIYQDEMTASKNAISMKPYIVITDYTYISSLATALGFFNSAVTESLKVPVLYLINDVTKVGKDLSSKSKAEYHALLAHELQHGILYYYKGSSDQYCIDEGLAHLMEDVFGYRDAGNFESHAFKFLSGLAEDPSPYLATPAYYESLDASTADDLKIFYRGGGHAFMYYLASQKGGFTFTDAVISGGGGLDFIRAAVQGKKTGMVGLSEVYLSGSGSWRDVVGGYIAALYLDNSTVKGVASKYQVMAPLSSIKNLQGGSGNGFGMRFNNFSGVDNTLDAVVPLSSDTFELYHYQGKPFRYAVSAGTSVSIDLTADNAAALKIRVK